MSHGKYLLIETGHNMTSKDYMEAGSGCNPGQMRTEISCAGGWRRVEEESLKCPTKVKI